MLFPETVTDGRYKLEPEAAPKQPEAGLRSVSSEASEPADGEVGLGFTAVALGSVGWKEKEPGPWWFPSAS